MSTPHEDPAEELAELAAALRAHAELQLSTGALGLPRATRELAEARGMPSFDAAPGAAEQGGSRSGARSADRPRPDAAGPNAGAPNAAHITQRAAPARSERAPAAESRTARVPAAESRAPTPAGEIRLPAEPRPGTPVLGATGPGLPLEERIRRLDVLADEVKGCTACRLHETRTQTVFARGTPRSGLCFVGEGPGEDEDAQGFPFVGKAGQLLDRMIEAMGLERDEVMILNIVKCRPPNNRKPEPDEMAACRDFLERQIELVSPDVIVALGATAVQGLLGISGIMRLRGNWKLYKGKIAVMPTFHPAYLLRTPSAKRDVWNDLQEVLRQMGRPVPPPRKA